MTERKLLCFSDHNYFQEEGGAEPPGLTEFLEGVAVLQAIKYFRWDDDEPCWLDLSLLSPRCLVYFFVARKLLCVLWWQGPGCCWWLGQFPSLWASEAMVLSGAQLEGLL